MKKEKIWLMGFLVFLLMPFNIWAEEINAPSTIENNYGELVNDPKTNDVYYYKDGEKLTGFQTMKDGKTYFFGLKSGKMLTGWQELDGKKFYLFPEVREGIQEIDGDNYFIDNNYIKYGFQKNSDGKIYYFGKTSGKMLTGWQELDGKKFYLFPEIREGIQEIDGNNYFIEDNYIKYGFQKNSDGKIYYFGKTSGKMLTGWQELDGERFYLFPEIREGLQAIDGDNYFIEDNYIKYGFQKASDGYTYYFDNESGKMLKGWQMLKNKLFYLDEAGHLRTVDGWFTLDDKEYYIKDGYAYLGINTIEGITYYFHPTEGYKEKGWFDLGEDRFYSDPITGELAHYWEDIDGERYYFGNTTYKLQKGLITVCDSDGTVCSDEDRHSYFMGNTTGRLLKGKQTYKYKDYYLNEETGILEKIQYVPFYYNQKDARWADIKYGLSKFGGSGCSPTSMAMAFTSILGEKILPTDVADYLYWNTDQFNRRASGTLGLGINYAADYYKIQHKGIGSKEEFVEALKSGKIVYATMANGTFATPFWNHAILVYDYNEEDNTTMAADPLKIENNTWHNVDKVWNERIIDLGNSTDGYAFHVLG